MLPGLGRETRPHPPTVSRRRGGKISVLLYDDAHIGVPDFLARIHEPV